MPPPCSFQALPFISGLISTARLELQWDSLLMRSLVVSACLLAGGVATYTLRRRQASAATRLAAGGFWRLVAAGLGALGIIFIAGGLVVARARAQALVHPARLTTLIAPETVGLTAYQSVSFLSADGLTLRGWYVPPRNGAVIIFVHGFACNRSAFLPEAALLAKHGYGALLFDLRNSGESDGDTTTLGLREVNDVQGAVDFVLAQPGGGANRLGLMGISMGGATVILSAVRLPQVSAVVAESAYASLPDSLDVTFKQMTGLPPFPFAPLVTFIGEREAGISIYQVRPVAEIAAISPRPILLVHGGQDPMIPVANVSALYAAAKEPKALYVVNQAGHGGFLEAEPQDYPRHLVDFFDKSLLEP
jgi:dipeptidyl aminopeptidase/acylaminoacyl peptidase